MKTYLNGRLCDTGSDMPRDPSRQVSAQPARPLLTRANRVTFLAAAILAASLWGPASVQATTYNWNQSTPATYNITTDWTPNGLPGAADTATVGNSTTASGSVLYDNSSYAYAFSLLQLGQAANSSGTFTMSAGALSITNASGTGLALGNAAGATGNFTISGGTLTLLRNASTFYQDLLQIGPTAGGTGTMTLNNGSTVNCYGGIELGSAGIGTLTVNGGTLLDNGWFGVGRGNSAAGGGSGTFNLNGGIVYLLRNPNTETSNSGLSPCQQGTNATISITGGALYVNIIRFQAASGTGTKNEWETFTMSGGDLYIGSGGVHDNKGSGTHHTTITLSGGTFHDVDMGPNTGGTQGLASILSDGANWSWDPTLPATINNSPSPGYITFAPDANRSITLSNVFSGNGGLALTGPGTLVLDGASTYTGTTTVSGGNLVIGVPGAYAGDTSLTGGTISGTGSVPGNATASPGGTIAPGSGGAPGTLTLGATSLTLNGDTNIIKLSADPTTAGGGVNDLLATTGNLVLQNVSTIKVVPLAPLSTTTPYMVMQYGSTPLLASDATHLRVTSDSPRYSFTVVDPSTTYPYVEISVSGNPADLVWRGTNAPSQGVWDHTTTNWLNTGSSVFDVFYNGDNSVFDDSGTNSVTVSGTEQPVVMVMSNNAVAYKFLGNGSLTGPLDMEGTNSLMLALSATPALLGVTNNAGALIFNLANGAANTISAPISDNGLGNGTLIQGGTNTVLLSADNSSYNGKILVTNGILQYASANSLGAIGVSLYVSNNGTLDFAHVNAGSKPIHVSGAGYNGMGALTDSGSGGVNYTVDSITLEGDTTFGAVGRWEQPAAGTSFTGNDYNLTMAGSANGVVLLNSDGATGLGNIHVISGRLGFENLIDLGDPTKTVTVETNAILTLYATVSPGAPTPITKNMVLNNGSYLDSGGGANTLAGAVTLAGTNNLGLRTDLHLPGVVSGAGGWVISTNNSVGNGNGGLYLDSTSPNTYSGVTVLNQGVVVTVGANSSLGTSSLISLNTGSKLDVSAQSAFGFGNGQTLMGLGTLNSQSAYFASGSTLSVGLSSTATATLTVNGNLTFQAGSTNRFKVKPGATPACDLVTCSASVNYGGTLVVTKIGSGAFAAGNVFQLFSAAGGFGLPSFATFVLPDPGPGLGWDTTHLTADGTIRVIARPQITSESVLGDHNIQLTFTADAASASYILLASTNVALPLATWTQIGSGTIIGSPMTIRDLTATNYPHRFYTILLP